MWQISCARESDGDRYDYAANDDDDADDAGSVGHDGPTPLYTLAPVARGVLVCRSVKWPDGIVCCLASAEPSHTVDRVPLSPVPSRPVPMISYRSIRAYQ